MRTFCPRQLACFFGVPFTRPPQFPPVLLQAVVPPDRPDRPEAEIPSGSAGGLRFRPLSFSMSRKTRAAPPRCRSSWQVSATPATSKRVPCLKIAQCIQCATKKPSNTHETKNAQHPQNRSFRFYSVFNSFKTCLLLVLGKCSSLILLISGHPFRCWNHLRNWVDGSTCPASWVQATWRETSARTCPESRVLLNDNRCDVCSSKCFRQSLGSRQWEKDSLNKFNTCSTSRSMVCTYMMGIWQITSMKALLFVAFNVCHFCGSMACRQTIQGKS